MKLPGTILIASVMVLLLSGATASAEDKDLIRLQLDVVALKQTILELQKSIDAKNTAMGLQLDKMTDQVNNLTENMRKVTDLVGTIKSDNAAANAAAAANATKSTAETRDALIPLFGELRKSIDQLKEIQNANLAQTRTLSDQVMAMKSTSTPLPTCKDVKQRGDGSYFSGYYDDAVSDYREFMNTCKSDPKAPEVQYNIADAFYQLKKFDQAILDYDIFLNNYPGHDKTASALLRKGQAHAELKQDADARAAYTRVITEFKGSSEAATAAAKIRELGPAPAGRGGRGN